MKKLAIGGALAATVFGGSIAVAALTPIGSAFAGSGAQTVAVDTGQTSSSAPAAGQGAKGPGRFQQALDDLVKAGTITQAQEDAIKQKLESTVGKGGGGRRGPGGPGGAGFIRPGLDAVAKSIGISTADLGTALKSGQTIAQVAQAHGVDPQKVINDLTTDANAKIDAAVASGKLKQEMADKIKAGLADGITKLVNGSFHGFPGGPGGRGGHGGAPGTSRDGAPGTGGSTGGLNGGSTPSTDAPTTAPSTTAAPATSDTTAAQPSGTLGG